MSRHLGLRQAKRQPHSLAELIQITDWANAKQLGALEQHKWLILAVGLGAGLRGVEMDHLTWKWVEVDDCGVMFRDVDGRDMAMHREWADVLEKQGQR
ncbi:hypothetical protein GP475_01080 [Corynebacterium poyangense]|uniref:Uncharacterized protein n=1 Tax=Corynebacterium poyangense TaxID=2684405 RepID=A0A7H0SLF5_9CORY|nr:hypothetical protein [Corynebacterium poyangense]MBZ8177473.1 hypothetical protein [Corynebacterium poyangense]QNQ89380.1 hypothetical protein GP475_01080 [Corynebacterium poyangense]